MSDVPGRDAFEARVNSPFQVIESTFEAIPVDVQLQLTECTDQSNPQCDCYSLIFEGPNEAFLPQATYTLQHAEMGDLPLFLVPVGNHGGRFQYQSIVNRLKAK